MLLLLLLLLGRASPIHSLVVIFVAMGVLVFG